MMNDDLYKGYKGEARKKLIENNVKVWSDVKMTTVDAEIEGIILPRTETADDQHIVLKMPSGYNSGFRIENIHLSLSGTGSENMKPLKFRL